MIKADVLFEYLFDRGFQPEYVEEDTEITVCCNLCSDDRPRLYISADTGAWTCFHCGESGSLHRLLLAICELSGTEAFDLGRQIRNAEADDGLDHFELREDKQARPVQATEIALPQQMQYFLGPSTNGPYAKYLLQRGVSLALASARGIGYCASGRYARRIIVPVETDGHLYTFIARTILSKCPNCAERLAECVCSRPFPKVLTPKGGHPRLTLYNFDAVQRAGLSRVVVVEGVFDALRFPMEAVAILGSTASATQLALLAGLAHGGRDVIVALDGDEAGYRGAVRLADALTSELVKVRVALLPEGRDPGSLNATELERCIYTAGRYVL